MTPLQRVRAFTGRCVLAIALAGMAAEAADNQPGPEYEIKAAFLFNFAKFVEWPGLNESATFNVCLVGEDPFGRLLESAFLGKSVHNLPVVIRRLGSQFAEARSCQVVFISASERRRFKDVLSGLAGAPVLTVSDSPSFPAAGGVVNFYVDNHRVRFEISPENAEKGRLRISSQLLRLARLIRDNGRDNR